MLFEEGDDAMNGLIVQDEDLAALQGSLVLGLIKCRFRRILYAWQGWPNSLAKLLGSPGEAEAVMKAFHRDWQNWEKLKACAQPTATVKRYLHRSPFQPHGGPAVRDRL